MHPERHRVFLFQRTIPVYRDAIFQRLYESLGVVVCHSPSLAQQGKQVADDVARTDRVTVPGRFLRGNSGPSTQAVLPVLLKYRPRVVIAQFSFGVMTFWKLLLFKPLFRYKLIPWSHGIRNDLWCRTNKPHRSVVARIVYVLCDAALFYSSARFHKLLGSYPALLRKSFVANNTLDTEGLDSIRRLLSDNSESSGRTVDSKKLGFNVIFIGRLLPGKRLDLVLRAWEILRSKHQVRLTVVGDGPCSRELAEYSDVPDVFAAGAINDNYLSALLLENADVHVMPGEVGLGIVHGFAFGLPMITCRPTPDGPYHGPEIEYLKDGYNGFFCDSTPESIAACIERLILDPELLARMKENALETVRTEANVERMIDGFRQAIDYVTRDDK